MLYTNMKESFFKISPFISRMEIHIYQNWKNHKIVGFENVDIYTKMLTLLNLKKAAFSSLFATQSWQCHLPFRDKTLKE